MKSRLLMLSGLILFCTRIGAAEEAIESKRAEARKEAGTLREETPAEKFIAFKNLKASQQSDWFDYMKRVHDNKYDLLKQIHTDWASYQNQNSRDWQNNTNCSSEQKDKIFTDQLDRAVTLYRNNMEQFKKLCENERNEAQQIQERHEEALDSFLGEPKSKKAAAEEAKRPMPAQPMSRVTVERVIPTR